ncbi:MAG: hypothetical protein JWP66_1878 [Naasia sp.]|nr:hypothetical protein [Naasia sp.]
MAPRRYGSTSRVRRLLTIIGVIVGVAVTAALVALALARTGALTIDAPPTAGGDATASARPTDPANPEPSEAPGTPVAAARHLSAFDELTAWRSYGGSCPADPAAAETTTDGGVIWSGRDPASATGAAGILRIEASNPGLVYLVSQDPASDCAPVYLASYNGGEQFQAYPDRVAGTWYLDVAAAQLHAPGGPVPGPCTVTAIAPRNSAEAAVLCAEGGVNRTSDGGATWGPALAVEGALALDDAGAGYVVAVAGRDGCAGVQVLPLDGAPDGDAGDPGECLPAEYDAASVAISSGGDAVWVWAGATLAVSEDSGRTW